MTVKPKSKKTAAVVIAFGLLLLGAGACFLTSLWKTREQREDYRQISSLTYDSVFLSMYPVDTYEEEDFAYFRAMTLFKASYCIPEFSVVEQYMERIMASGNQVTTAYLGLLPHKTDLDSLQALMERYPSVTFEIILPYPSSEYWAGLSESRYEQEKKAYCDFLTALPDMPSFDVNASFYFFASQEWLIANPSNYEEEWLVTAPIARTIMTYSDRAHENLITRENAPALARALEDLIQKLRYQPEDYPDLSDTCIVFFGDSIIGNYIDSTSIPGVVAGLTGAEVFNCGYGGNSAALGPDLLISLPGIVDAFFQGDLTVLPEDTQVYRGTAAYLSNPPQDKKLCFVIHYGFNDYAGGFPLSSEDPLDTSTYYGALRRAVETIRSQAPDARIILSSPLFTAQFQGGAEPNSSGHVLADYVQTVRSLSEELSTDLLDNYQNLGINSENHGLYLLDQVHPNAACRYLMGKNLIRLIEGREQ